MSADARLKAANEIIADQNRALAKVHAEPSESAAIIHMIERAARDPAVDIDKMQRLLDLRRQVRADEAKAAFAQAMKAAQTEMRPVARDSNNPQTKSHYASYLAIDTAIRPIYTKHGFSPTFDTGDGAPENCIRVICELLHDGGYSRSYHIDMPADGKGAKGGDVMTKTHATGAAMTYGQRYLLKMIFNIATGEIDDDGNGASTGEVISERQYETLAAMVHEAHADLNKFLAYLKVPSLSDLPAHRYDAAVAALNAKMKKAAQ